jgi:transcriptional regulator with XRE-family HTH domain
LGLIAEPALRFDGSAVKRARLRAGLKLPQLVQKLVQRGWDVSNSEALGWETGRSGAIAPALIAAVADILGASQSSLAASAPTNDPLSAIRATEVFRQLVARAAEALSVPWEVAAAKLESAAAIPVHRGGTPDIDAALQSLEVLVEELESRRE